MDDWQFPDPYLPIKSSKGEPDLAYFSGCSEGVLRKAIKAGELKHFRNSPRGKILVRVSWFDEWAKKQQGEEFRIHEKAQRFIQELLEKVRKKKEAEEALEERAQRFVEELLEKAAKSKRSKRVQRH